MTPIKTVILGLFALMFSGFAEAAIHLNVESGKIVGLWNFTLSISETGRRQSKILQDIFKQSNYAKDPSILSKLQEFKVTNEKSFNKKFHFDAFPEKRGEMGWATSPHFDYQATQSKTLKEFQSRTAQVIAPSEHLKIFKILEAIAPIYDELVWKPSESKLKDRTKKILETWEKAQLSDLLAKTISFYRSTWPKDFEMTIYAMPIPAVKGHTRATVIQDSIILESLLDSPDVAGLTGVLFHEICHAAYESETAEDQHQLVKWFEESASPLKNYAEELLNEGLATAIGNGMAFQAITGKEDSEDWYSVREINEGAKAAYSFIRSYILASKPMDADFVKKWIESYQKTFPDAMITPDMRLRDAVLLTDGEIVKHRDAKNQIKNVYRFAQFSSGSPIDAKESLRDIKDAGAKASLIIIAGASFLSQVEKLSMKVPELKKAIPLIKKKGGPRYISYLSGDRPVFLFRVDKFEDFPILLEKLSKTKTISKSLVPIY